MVVKKAPSRKIPDQEDLLIYSIQLQRKTESQFYTNSSYINHLDTETKKENHRARAPGTQRGAKILNKKTYKIKSNNIKKSYHDQEFHPKNVMLIQQLI